MGKKRPKPGSGGGTEPTGDKKAPLDVEEGPSSVNDSDRLYIFKDPAYLSRSGGNGKKPRVWKSLKQVISAERLMPGSSASYAALEAPLSLKPSKKYSDTSGLPARYTDPATKLRYANVDEYARIRLLTPDQVNGYLILRKASLPVT
ncbi:unnamed protein product [Ixodes persulcatus]|uniref:Vps72/YL1 C-terminal domain-containing protein n=1 Tax=Ixodes scapularis TaxID=6945 RepID=B7P2K1_IXOSC|nr:conserved hypothetical protein [Ixodes scapularis]|eukprot:XP_002402461.1 conserved hypothetical protein [Ixodes scapularis]